jgi:hypothetical protein
VQLQRLVRAVNGHLARKPFGHRHQGVIRLCLVGQPGGLILKVAGGADAGSHLGQFGLVT